MATNSAFYAIKMQMQNSNSDLSKIISKEVENIQPIIHKKPKLKAPLNKGINEIRVAISEFNEKIDELNTMLSAAALIRNENILNDQEALEKILSESTIDSIYFNGNVLCRFNNYGDIIISDDQKWVKYMLIDLKHGDKLKQLIIDTRKQLIEQYTITLKSCQKEAWMSSQVLDARINSIEKNMPLKLDEYWQHLPDKNTWSEHQFDNLTYAACMTKLEQEKSNAKISEAILVHQLTSLAER